MSGAAVSKLNELYACFYVREFPAQALLRLNATFYGHVEPAIARKWSDAVENPGFEFAIKAAQLFTHVSGSKPSQRKAPTSVERINDIS